MYYAFPRIQSKQSAMYRCLLVFISIQISTTAQKSTFQPLPMIIRIALFSRLCIVTTLQTLTLPSNVAIKIVVFCYPDLHFQGKQMQIITELFPYTSLGLYGIRRRRVAAVAIFTGDRMLLRCVRYISISWRIF